MYKVSVIIPVYNVEQYLEQCIDSVINQTYKNFEIICVNDCTPDNSAQILQEYAQKDSRIKIITHEKNGGPSAARNSGLDIACGEYIYFIDSDDWIDLDYIEKMVKVAEATQADIIINKSIMTEFSNQSKEYVHANETKLELNSYIDGIKNIENVFWVAWSKLYKTSFLKSNKLLFPVGHINEDLYFHHIVFALAKSIYYTKLSYYHYRDSGNSISKTQNDIGVNFIHIYNLIYDFYNKRNLLNKKAKIYSTMPSFNIKNEEIYKVYKAYFDKVINYLNQNAEIFNELDLYFANSVANSKDYADYASKYPASATISYIRRRK